MVVTSNRHSDELLCHSNDTSTTAVSTTHADAAAKPQAGSMDVDTAFCRRLPKVELHAHLSGSVTTPTLQAIWSSLPESERAELAPPETALADPSGAQGISAFFAHFNTYIYRLLRTRQALAQATRAVLEEFAADGVVYLELRTTPRVLDGEEADAGVRVVLDEIERSNAVGGPMQTALILSVDRAKHDLPAAQGIVDMALALRAEGHPIVGLDLCGDPNASRPVAELTPAFARARDAGLPCVVHFAEVPASSDPDELLELLSWRPRRLGHAIHVPPELRSRIARQGVGVEMCLSCNVLAGMLPVPRAHGFKGGEAQATEPAPSQPACGIADHHFPDWWATDAPISLGTDDVGVFGSPSSAEHAHAAAHFSLSRADLVTLCKRAMEAALDDAGRERDRVNETLAAFAKAEGIPWP